MTTQCSGDLGDNVPLNGSHDESSGNNGFRLGLDGWIIELAGESVSFDVLAAWSVSNPEIKS
jgi:hypothetical protein